MDLRQQLTNDLKEAMRQRDERRKTTIRSVIAAVKQAETELDREGKRISLDNEGILALIHKQANGPEGWIVGAVRVTTAELVVEDDWATALRKALQRLKSLV